MKITEVGWRARIGQGRPVKYGWKYKKLLNLTANIFLGRNIVTLNLIVTLLLIGCVEMNPGPMDVRDISNKTLSKVLCTISGDKHPYKAQSVWGRASQIVFGMNSFKLRQFLCNLSNILPDTDNDKYFSTTLKSVIDALDKVSDTATLSQNQLHAESVWGKLAAVLYSTNTIKDRNYLATFWRIGALVTSLPDVIPRETIKNTSISFSKERKKRNMERSKTKERKKRKPGKKESIQLPEILPPLPNTPIDILPLSQDMINNLVEEYNSSVCTFTDSFCEICDKMIYRTQAKTLQVTDEIRRKFYEIDKELVLNPRITACDRCYKNLKRLNPNVPPTALCNNLKLHDVPPELIDLTVPEIGLIKQVRAYMRIYLLCRGRGQKAIKGLTVHFPLQVQEVINCLPNVSGQEDVVVIHQILGEINEPRDITIRPKRVLEALKWLKVNNTLYTNVEINFDFEFTGLNSVRIDHNGDDEFDTDQSVNIPLSYVVIGDGQEILRCSVNQSNPVFNENAGKQCTAMCASFLAFCFVDNPRTWTREISDKVLVKGNAYYGEKLNENHEFLNSDDVEGTIKVFDSFDVQLEIIRTHLFNLQGYLKTFPGMDCPRLNDVILRFIEYGYTYGIITCNQYSMGLFIDEENIYFFDSHSRGKKGCKSVNGKACVIKFNRSIAANKISYIVNRNCLPTNPFKTQVNDYIFTLTPFDVKSTTNNTITESSGGNKNPQIMSGDYMDTSSSDSNDSEESDNVDNFVEPFGKLDGADCVIDRIDVLEPEIEEILGQVTLNRQIKNPLNEYHEKYLDVLSFPHLFPDGKNGLNEFRKIPITPLDYFQQRLMSRYTRFRNNAEYIFYGVCHCDKYRARQKIAVCCSMTKQGDSSDNANVFEEFGIRDPHIYMSSIRGSASYWKKYCGDLVGMVKSLGIPTFFVTVSFDDLNSFDCVNALYKAEHGYNSEDIDHSTLDFQTRKDLLNAHPITAARHFSMRLTKLLAFFKKHDIAPFGLPLADYSVRVEFQSRGSPHAHMLLWLENAPDFRTKEGKKTSGEKHLLLFIWSY